MYQYELKRKRIIVGLLLLGILLPVLYFANRSISQAGKIAVTVNILPSDAKLTIDKKEVSGDTIYLKPGNHTVSANRAGFTSLSSSMWIDNSKKTIAISLEPKSEEAKQWVKDHQADYDRMKVVGEKAAKEAGISFNAKNPIAADLPYRTFTYTIGYQADPSDPSGNSIILTIDAPEGYRQAALYRIRQLGYDPTDFTINFRNYENPFPL